MKNMNNLIKTFVIGLLSSASVICSLAGSVPVILTGAERHTLEAVGRA